LINVCDDDGFRTGCSTAEEAHKPNRSGATDQNRVTQSNLRSLHACQADTQRLEHSAILIAHVADFMTPRRGMVHVTAKKTIDGRRRHEAHLQAAIVPSIQTWFALIADRRRLNGHTIADFVGFHGWMDSNDFPG